MDDAVFYRRIRSSLYGGRLKQVTVDNINVILGYWRTNFNDNPDAQLAYVLATVLAEVGRNMRPVRETFATSDAQARARLRHKAYAQSQPPFGHAYYGRGYVQLTWKDNYALQEQKIGEPLVEFPDRALQTNIAVRILVEGMMAGDFNGHGHGLPFYVNDTNIDFVQARRTVNILDRAVEIAGYATKFLDAIEVSRLSAARMTSFSPLLSEAEAAAEPPLILPSPEHMAAQRQREDTAETGEDNELDND